MLFAPVIEWRKDCHVSSFTRVMHEIASPKGRIQVESDNSEDEDTHCIRGDKARALVFIKGREASNEVCHLACKNLCLWLCIVSSLREC